MTDGESVIPVVVTLGEPLRPLAEAPGLAARTRGRIDALTASLGIPGRADVSVRACDEGRPVSIAVHGTSVEYSRALDQQVLAWHRHLREPAGTGSPTLPSWQDQLAADHEACADAVADLARHAFAASPSALVGPGQVSDWVKRAGMEPRDGTAGLLATILGLRLSIADHARIAGVLAEHPDDAMADIAEHAVEALRPRALVVRVAPAYLEELTTSGFDSNGDVFPFLRDGVYTELGLRLPSLLLIPDSAVADRCFTVRVNDVDGPPIVGVPSGMCLVNASAAQLAPDVTDVWSALNPGTGRPASYALATHRDALTQAGYTTWDPLGHLILTLAETARAHAAALLDRAVVARELDTFAEWHPVLASTARALVPVSRLTRLLRALLDERIPVRDLRCLLQALVDQEARGGIPETDEGLAALAMRSYGGAITRNALQRGSIPCYLIDPALAARLSAADGEAALEARRSLVAALDAELAKLPPGSATPAIVTSSGVRLPVRRAIRAAWPRLTVLAYEDLDPATNMQPLARLSGESS